MIGALSVLGFGSDQGSLLSIGDENTFHVTIFGVDLGINTSNLGLVELCTKLYAHSYASRNHFLRGIVLSRGHLIAENMALRQQLAALKLKNPRPRLNNADRMFWVLLRKLWSKWVDSLIIVKPETVVGWHRKGFRLYWKLISRPSRVGGRPKIAKEIRDLIRRMA